jgi:hypothetical protein
MCRYYFPLSFLASFLLSACVSQRAPLSATATASYALDGEEERAKVRFALDPESTGGTLLAYVTLSSGSPHVVAGYVEATYEAPFAQPRGPYHLLDLTYTYALASDTTHPYVLHFMSKAQGTLTQTKTGSYRGTFAGHYDGRTTGLLAEVFNLQGQFGYAGPVTNLREDLGVPLPK